MKLDNQTLSRILAGLVPTDKKCGWRDFYKAGENTTVYCDGKADGWNECRDEMLGNIEKKSEEILREIEKALEEKR